MKNRKLEKVIEEANQNKVEKDSLCETCGKPYNKFEIGFCSSSFHCCRDCKWSDKTPQGFNCGTLLVWCDDCKNTYQEAYNGLLNSKDELMCNVCKGHFEVKAGDYPFSCPLCEATFCGEECCGVCAEYIRTKDEYFKEFKNGN